MSKRLGIFSILVVFLLVFAAGCGGGSKSVGDSQGKPAEKAKERVLLNVGTTNKTSSAYSYYVASLQAFKNKAPHIQATLVETGASVDNVERIIKGQVDYGLSSHDVAFEAYKGIGRWKDKAVPDLRVVMMWTSNAVPYVVRADSGVNTPYDLNGKRFSPGMRGSGNEAMCEAVFGALGVKPDWYRGSLEDAANAMKDNQIVGTNKTSVGTQPDATFIDIQTFIKIKALDWKPEDIKKVQEKYPYYLTAVIPAKSFKDQEKDVTTWAIIMGDVASSKLSKDVVYDIVKALFEQKSILSQSYKGCADTDWVKATLQSPIPLHAGTVKYLKETGVQVPDNLIPPEAK